jgi:hypothetical protein
VCTWQLLHKVLWNKRFNTQPCIYSALVDNSISRERSRLVAEYKRRTGRSEKRRNSLGEQGWNTRLPEHDIRANDLQMLVASESKGSVLAYQIEAVRVRFLQCVDGIRF